MDKQKVSEGWNDFTDLFNHQLYLIGIIKNHLLKNLMFLIVFKDQAFGDLWYKLGSIFHQNKISFVLE
jgi:hypothetical protein